MDVSDQANRMLRLTPVPANETGTSDLAVSRDQTNSLIPAFQEAMDLNQTVAKLYGD